MAIKSPLKGREVPGHKYIKRIVTDSGKYRYIYDSTAEGAKEGAKSISSLRSGSSPQGSGGNSKPGMYTGKTSSWVTAYYAAKNKKLSSLNSEQIAAGEAAASKKVSTGGRSSSSSSSSQKWDTKVERARLADQSPTKEEYKEAYDKLETETNQKKTDNETYYKNLYEQEKQSQKEKLMRGLRAKYGSNIPKEEEDKVNKQVEEDTKTLWQDVYEPLLSKVNDAIDDANKAVMRILKKKFE